MSEVHYMSQEGLDKLKKELAEALAQRPVIAAAIAEAREKGDLSENAEYESAREAQGLLELKIAKLQNQVVNAKVLDSSQLNCDQVQMLNTVKVENLANHRVMGKGEYLFSAKLNSSYSSYMPSGLTFYHFLTDKNGLARYDLGATRLIYENGTVEGNPTDKQEQGIKRMYRILQRAGKTRTNIEYDFQF